MSDGPHQSLRMRKAWKELAKRADNDAYASDDVRAALDGALERDWRADVPTSLPDKVLDALSVDQASLFGGDQRIERLEELRTQALGHVSASVLIDCVIDAVRTGANGEAALQEGAALALEERAARGIRQVSEHYHRESSAARADNVADRLQRTCMQTNWSNLASQILLRSDQRTGKIEKQSGIDEGVSLK